MHWFLDDVNKIAEFDFLAPRQLLTQRISKQECRSKKFISPLSLSTVNHYFDIFSMAASTTTFSLSTIIHLDVILATPSISTSFILCNILYVSPMSSFHLLKLPNFFCFLGNSSSCERRWWDLSLYVARDLSQLQLRCTLQVFSSPSLFRFF